jgi:hypothetical protein
VTDGMIVVTTAADEIVTVTDVMIAADATAMTATIATTAAVTPTQCRSVLKTSSTTTSTTELVTRFE